MLGFGKKGLKEGDFIFARQPDGEYNKIIFGVVTGVQGTKIGVNGIIINPVGLKNKIEQGNACDNFGCWFWFTNGPTYKRYSKSTIRYQW